MNDGLASRMDNLARLLAAGYGFAALAAVGVAIETGSVLGAVALFWLGGPTLVLGLAVAPGRIGARFRRARRDGADSHRVALDEELARWEADRLADRADAPPDRKVANG